MGSSIKKKKEKQKDFQKPKFKVGKAKAKPSNFTDTSFKAKSIIIGEQFHPSDTPDEAAHAFKHQLSLAATARSDKQRRDALASLANQISATPLANPVGTHTLLAKLLPLVSDSATPVRAQLLRLLRSLPPADVRRDAERVAIFVRAGMTHLSADVSNDALAVLDWLLEVAAEETVSCPGGWVKTLNSFCALMGWSGSSNSGWSSAPARPTLKTKDSSSRARQLATLTQFLRAGFEAETPPPGGGGREITDAYWGNVYRVPRASQPFEYLNLFGGRRDEDGATYPRREARQRVFCKRFRDVFEKGVEAAKKEGGLTGRAAAELDAVIRQGTKDFEATEAMELEDWMLPW